MEEKKGEIFQSNKDSTLFLKPIKIYHLIKFKFILVIKSNLPLKQVIYQFESINWFKLYNQIK